MTGVQTCALPISESGKLKLIDWESLRFSEPAKDVANVLTDLRLKGKDLILFIETYQRYRKDEDILERAKVYALLNRYANVVWEILRSFEIINKDLPKEYLQKTTAESHIKEAKSQLRELRKLIKISNFDVDCFFE